MSTPVKTISVRTTVMDALLELIKAGIGHLVVVDDGKVVGVVTRKDIQSLYGRIVKASSLSELEVMFKRIKSSVAKVALTGLGFYHLSGLISTTYDALTGKVIEILREARSASSFTWLHMGSSGRREQIIATDQDSAMICGADDLVPFARDVTENLNRLGMPNCPGDYMASNPQWNQNISAWKHCVHDWFNNPVPDHVRYLSIFLDSRPVYGDERVHRELVEFMKANITRKAIELLAYDAIELEPPLGIFGIIGLHKGVDLKTYGIYPIVNGVRVLVLESGMLEVTNTKDRLELLRQKGMISDNLCHDLIESYGFIQDIRTRHHSTAVLSHAHEDNLISGKEIDKVDLLLLKESLKIVASFQRFLMARYGIKRSGGIL
jgi:CBS domain-containing protein